MGGILHGTYPIIDKFFSIGRVGKSTPHYQHKTSCQKLSDEPRLDIDRYDLVHQLFDRITANWRNAQRSKPRSPSGENWRFKPRKCYVSKSPEVQLEREIVKTSSDWVNQVPTSSGLVSPYDDRVRNIDLVAEVKPCEFEFVELKVASNTPLFAAMEILGYGVIYLVSRCHIAEMGYDEKHKGWSILRAYDIHLKVLAPQKFYANYELGWLESLINDGLEQFLGMHSEIPLRMDFRFEAFPADFRWPPAETNNVDLVNVMGKRRPVYPPQRSVGD